MRAKYLKRGFLFIGLAGVFTSAAFAATIEGTVKYEGKVPTLPPLKMDTDADCMKKHSSVPVAEFLVLGDGNTMGNIFVSVKSGIPADKTFPAPKDPVIINQEGCIYHPHVVGIMANQPLKFRNADGILHNVHALPQVNRPFNIAMPATMTESPDQNFAKVEDKPFVIKCDVHGWMGAYVKVMPHPFFSVTQKDGKFKIPSLPAGTYEIEAWHEKLPPITQTITVAENDTKTVDFTFKK